MENKTDIQQLIDRNYAAQVKRGQINNESTFGNFSDKIQDELNEFNESYIQTNKDFDSKELIDIMLVCFSVAKHFGIDWQQIMTDKVEFNEKRLD
jgi:NTP pyrophosphatase (non-canonical NTP hydrolase)